MGGIGESLLAWVVLPAVLYVLALGLGLLLRRLTRLDLPNALLPPLGFALAVVLVVPTFRLGVTGWGAGLPLVVAAAAGYLVNAGDLRRRLNPGILGLAGLAVFGLYLAPVVLSGGWTWTGYNFVNDTAVQLLLVDHLAAHGTQWPVRQLTAAQTFSVSTGQATVYYYLRSAYPIGAHAPLAALTRLTGAQSAAAYVPYIAALAAFAAMSVAVLARRALRSAGLAAGVGLAALGASLTYAYGMQGAVKEIAVVALLTASAALAVHVLDDRRALGGAFALGVCFAGVLAVFGAGGVPYVAALGACFAVAAYVMWARPGDRALVPQAIGVGILGAVLGILVAAPSLVQSVQVLRDTFGAGAQKAGVAAAQVASNLGQLLRPLPLIEGLGVWLGEYRAPVLGRGALLNTLLLALALALLLVGIVHLVRRRGLAPLLLFVPVAGVVVAVTPLVSPYAGAKLLAVAAPSAVLVAMVGALSLRSLRPVIGYGLAGVLLLGILASDALTYHKVTLAPIKRMEAMEDLDHRYANRGPVVVAELDELAKYFMRDPLIISAFDPISPFQFELRGGSSFSNQYWDLDDLSTRFVTQGRWLVQRRSPVASRPPASFRLDYANAYYSVWRQDRSIEVVEHMPAQQTYQVAGHIACRDLARMAHRTGHGESLVAVLRPRVPELDTPHAHRSPGWPPHSYRPDAVLPGTPGQAWANVAAAAGRYRVWVQGSFGRPVQARVDGRTVGSAEGVESLGQWHLVGEVTLRAGRHRLELERGGGGLAPGDGYVDSLGPLALDPLTPPRMVRVPPAQYRRLCGRDLDWVERVRFPRR